MDKADVWGCRSPRGNKYTSRISYISGIGIGFCLIQPVSLLLAAKYIPFFGTPHL